MSPVLASQTLDAATMPVRAESCLMAVAQPCHHIPDKLVICVQHYHGAEAGSNTAVLSLLLGSIPNKQISVRQAVSIEHLMSS